MPHPAPYEAPAIQRLGTLHELTLGACFAADDGFGGLGGVSIHGSC